MVPRARCGPRVPIAPSSAWVADAKLPRVHQPTATLPVRKQLRMIVRARTRAVSSRHRAGIEAAARRWCRRRVIRAVSRRAREPT